MSVMHPVGPEPQETYWVRRAVVIGTALVLMIILLLVLFNLNGGGQPAPAATPNPLPPLTSASPTPSAGAGTDSASPSADNSASPSASNSASRSASPSASGSGSASAESKSSATSSASSSASASASSTAKSTSNAKSNSTTTTQKTLTVCDPGDLTTTVKAGSRTASAGKPVTFTVSLVNGGTTNCVVTVNPADFSLKIYSGSDRIWSTADCSSLVKSNLAQLKPKQALTWTISWNGRRSASGCTNRPQTPRAGYYWATASFQGTDPARARLILTS